MNTNQHRQKISSRVSQLLDDVLAEQRLQIQQVRRQIQIAEQQAKIQPNCAESTLAKPRIRAA